MTTRYCATCHYWSARKWKMDGPWMTAKCLSGRSPKSGEYVKIRHCCGEYEAGEAVDR